MAFALLSLCRPRVEQVGLREHVHAQEPTLRARDETVIRAVVTAQPHEDLRSVVEAVIEQLVGVAVAKGGSGPGPTRAA